MAAGAAVSTCRHPQLRRRSQATTECASPAKAAWAGSVPYRTVITLSVRSASGAAVVHDATKAESASSDADTTWSVGPGRRSPDGGVVIQTRQSGTAAR